MGLALLPATAPVIIMPSLHRKLPLVLGILFVLFPPISCLSISECITLRYPKCIDFSLSYHSLFLDPSQANIKPDLFVLCFSLFYVWGQERFIPISDTCGHTSLVKLIIIRWLDIYGWDLWATGKVVCVCVIESWPPGCPQPSLGHSG